MKRLMKYVNKQISAILIPHPPAGRVIFIPHWPRMCFIAEGGLDLASASEVLELQLCSNMHREAPFPC